MNLNREVVVVGSVNADHRIEVEALPLPGETVLGGPVTLFAGGKAANQSVALARLGRAVSLVGAVGSDAAGRRLLDGLRAEGVDVGCLRQAEDVPTGQAVVLVDPHGENSIVVSPGANARVGAEEIRAARQRLSSAAVVLAQLEIPVAAVLEAARLAAGTFVLNPAPAAQLPQELWRHVDVVVPNRGELARLCGAEVPGDTAEVVRLARELPCERVVVTLGGRGAVVVEGPEATLIPAPAVTAVDTTGAGDCFCGALADGLAGELPLPEAAAFAVRAASLNVRQMGAQTSMPTRAQVEAFAAPSTGGLSTDTPSTDEEAT
ncbi:ribokinase [Streptomyces sp. TP-A0874]|uniref:ribokinase n=1 Tax=Streptomyces sp. TP-A0874 TaxID=549819 RepID=UPI000852C973|nr:ribokinase [Streptomyces sp. TP-A0874]